MSDNRPPTITVDSESVVLATEEVAASVIARVTAEVSEIVFKLLAEKRALESQGKSAGDPPWDEVNKALTSYLEDPTKSVTTLVTTQQSSNCLTPPPKDEFGRKAN